MSRIEALPSRMLATSGIVFCIASFAMMIGAPKAALTGWLAALVLVSALPLGALCLTMMMRIIPGVWRHELVTTTRSALLLLPLVVIAWMPIMFGLSSVYEWVSQPPPEPFKAVYLTPLFFDIRTLSILIGTCLLAWKLNRAQSLALAIIGLVCFVLLQGILATDWLMSLDPQFHSSGFGLYILAGQMLTALACLIILRIAIRKAEQPGVLGALLLTAILLWAYLAFMQYFIIWSGNLIPGVIWFQRRGTGTWAAVEYLIAFLHLLPLFLLFFPPIRHSVRWLLVLSLAILAGRSLEYAWLIMPQLIAHLDYALAAYALSLIGLGQLALAILSRSGSILARLTATTTVEVSP